MKKSFVPYLVLICSISQLIHDGSGATDCGVRAITRWSPYIVGGKEAFPNSWPWQVLLWMHSGNDEFRCGGSIISDQWVLTAAHCVFGRNVKVYAGKHYRKKGKFEPHEEEFTISPSDVIIHKNYGAKANDIALLKLPRKIKFNKYISPVCLPESNVSAGTLCTATGWGRDEEGKKPESSALKEVNITVNKPSECGPLFDNTARICAGETGKGTYKGDSGGPLVWYNPKKRAWYQHGITSCGKGTCGGGPRKYVRVYYYLGWIKSKSGNGGSSSGANVGTVFGAIGRVIVLGAIAALIWCMYR